MNNKSIRIASFLIIALAFVAVMFRMCVIKIRPGQTGVLNNQWGSGLQEKDFEPGFYDWLRGLALHRAGDHEGAETAFTRYFDQWPGDVIGIATTQELVAE